MSSFDVMRRSRVSLSWEFVLSKIAIVNLYKDFMDVKKTFPQYDETTMIQKGITFILFHFSFDLLLKLKMHTKGMNNLNKIKFPPKNYFVHFIIWINNNSCCISNENCIGLLLNMYVDVEKRMF